MGWSIQAVHAAAYRIPTDRPEGDGTLTWDSTTWIVVEVAAADPDTPHGLGWTYAPAAAASVVTDLLAPVIEGADLRDVGGCWQSMARAVRNAGRSGLVAMAVSAVDTALWDLKARTFGVPLHHLFGCVRSSVPVYGSGGFTTDSEQHLRTQLEGWLAEGMTQVKLKIGESWGCCEVRDLERVRLARGAIGPEVGLFVDANGGYQPKQAVRVAGRLEPFDVRWFEEPVSSDDADGLRFVRERTGIDIAAGEYGDGLAAFSRLLAAGAVDCLQIDVTRCGGYTEWQRAVALAAAHGLEVSGHCAPSLHAAVAMATPNLRHVEWFEDHVRLERRFLDGFVEPKQGSIEPDERPGNGLRLRTADLEPYRVA